MHSDPYCAMCGSECVSKLYLAAAHKAKIKCKVYGLYKNDIWIWWMNLNHWDESWIWRMNKIHEYDVWLWSMHMMYEYDDDYDILIWFMNMTHVYDLWLIFVDNNYRYYNVLLFVHLHNLYIPYILYNL